MKKSLIKLLSSTIALTLVLASSGMGTAQIDKIKAEDVKTDSTAVVQEVKEEKNENSIIAVIEEKMKEEAPVVEIVKTEASASKAEEKTEEIAIPEIKAVPVAEVTDPEIKADPIEEIAEPETEPDAVWNISAENSDNVAMNFYAEATADAEQVAVDRQSGVVYISGTGAMEKNVYRHFMSTEKFLTAMKAMFEAEYGVQVDLKYDETITDVLELDENIRYYSHETGEELGVTENMRANLNSADFLEYSPKAIYVGEGITNVSDFAFVCCEGLEEIVLPSTVESIGEYAFQYCGNLKKVVIPENAEIKTGAFSYCHSLETVQLAGAAYYNNGNTEENAESRVAPAATWNISATGSDNVSMVFYAESEADVNQVEVDRQSGVVYINGTGAMEENVYRHFLSIEKFLETTKALFEAEYGVQVDLEYDDTITDVLELDGNVRYFSHETREELFVTESMRAKLNPADFVEYSPKKIYVSEGITSISDFAFICCDGLEEIVLPSTIKTIGESAFQYCKSLKRVVLPEGTEIKMDAFSYCNNLEIFHADEAYYAQLAAEKNAAVRTLTAEEVQALVCGQ